MTSDRLTSDHIPQIMEIAASCFREAWSEEDYRYFLTHECAYSFGVFSAESPISLGAYLLALRVQGDIDIISIATRKEIRRKGLAEQLLKDAIADSGTKRLMLEVDVENTSAMALYLKMGFEVQGVRKKYYEAKRDAYFMTFQKNAVPK